MFNKWFLNRKSSRKRISHSDGFKFEIVEQSPKDKKQETAVPNIYIYGECTDEEKKSMQEGDSTNVIFCPPLTDEQKIQNSERMKNFKGIICKPLPDGFWDDYKEETWLSRFIKTFI